MSRLTVPSPEQFTSITSWWRHTCARSQAGAAFCWGYNSFGQLGGTPASIGARVQVAGGHVFSRLAAGGEFTCGLVSGSAWCWGLNGVGQLGSGPTDLVAHPTPVAVGAGHTFTALVAGFMTACGLTSGGDAWCWGDNSSGQLGLGTADADPHTTPVHAAPALTFTAIAPGAARTCGIASTTAVVCWGGGSAQLDPTPVDATTGFVELAAGGDNFCRVSGAGAVSCWGGWDLGARPAQPVHAVRVGQRHACATVVATGRVVCWGSDDWGQLGDAGTLYPPPVEPLGQP